MLIKQALCMSILIKPWAMLIAPKSYHTCSCYELCSSMSYAHLWAMLIYELCSCHELCPYHKLCLKYDQWPCHNRIIHPIRDDRRLKNWCFFGKGPNWGLFWTHWMLSKLSPPHVEDPAQYVHIPKRHSGIFRDHDRRIAVSYTHLTLPTICSV